MKISTPINANKYLVFLLIVNRDRRQLCEVDDGGVNFIVLFSQNSMIDAINNEYCISLRMIEPWAGCSIDTT